MLTIDAIRQKITPLCVNYEIERAYIFGSYARGEADEESDVDIRVEIDAKNKKLKTLLQETNFQMDIESALNKKVDLLTVLPPGSINQTIRNYILREEAVIYENNGEG